ncbi:hypothetical protein [Candidatus Pantoea carbekii]|uniref:hypothetical protein n=1 Tax=Candidatus Pantoea carbekii TaxID=1235990 RepID=UPI0038992FB9
MLPWGETNDFVFRIANHIVVNHQCAVGLEFTILGPMLRFHNDAVIVLTEAN